MRQAGAFSELPRVDTWVQYYHGCTIRHCRLDANTTAVLLYGYVSSIPMPRNNLFCMFIFSSVCRQTRHMPSNETVKKTNQVYGIVQYPLLLMSSDQIIMVASFGATANAKILAITATNLPLQDSVWRSQCSTPSLVEVCAERRLSSVSL